MEDYTVHLAFHPYNETHFNGALQRTNDLMEKYFGDEQKLVYENSSDKEMIYSVQKPIFLAPDSVNNFFQRLTAVFNAAAAMQPHFVKFEGESK